ncbi:hypothetical protein Cfor_08220, partial [Coptotermes formosanus]
MALPAFNRTRTCTGDQHDHLQYSTEQEALISLANDMFGLYTWSHNVTHQNIEKCKPSCQSISSQKPKITAFSSFLSTFPDYMDCDSNKYSVGVVSFVKVEFKNGIYHEDVSYGICSNSCCKGYATACARK